LGAVQGVAEFVTAADDAEDNNCLDCEVALTLGAVGGDARARL
jgi:hypothetical protein